MSSRSLTDKLLVVVGSFLIASNLVLQVLDWITTYVGFARGISEHNPETRWLIARVGNEYLGVGLEKVAYVVVFVLTYFLMVRVLRWKRLIPKEILLGVVYLVLFTIFLDYVATIVSNFGVLGW